MSSGIGGNTLYDQFTIKNEATIQPLQTWLENIVNDLLSQICTIEGGDNEYKSYGLKLPNVIGDMIEKFKGSPIMANPFDNQSPPKEEDEIDE